MMLAFVFPSASSATIHLSIHLFPFGSVSVLLVCPTTSVRSSIEPSIEPSIHPFQSPVRSFRSCTYQLFIRIFTFNKVFLGGWVFGLLVVCLGGCCYFWIYLEMKWLWIIEKEREGGGGGRAEVLEVVWWAWDVSLSV